MQLSIDSYRSNIYYVHHLGVLHDAISALTTSAIDCSDILRSQLVLAVSAFDQYIHELVRLGMLEAFQGLRSKTDAYCRYQVSLDIAHGGIGSGSSDWLSNEIRQKHSFQTFQQPDKVADAVRLISNKKMWNEVAAILGVSDVALKTNLKLIVERRNKIAHEADVDPSYPGQRWPITKIMVNDAVKFLNDVAEAIFVVVK